MPRHGVPGQPTRGDSTRCERFVQEAPCGCERAEVRRGVVCDTRRRPFAAWGVREAMHRDPVHVHLLVRAGLGHLLGERDQVAHGDVGIEHSVTDEHLCGNRARLGTLRGRETAVAY